MIGGIPSISNTVEMLRMEPREILEIKEFLPSQQKLLNWKPSLKKKSILLHGGTRSGKTVGICTLIAYICSCTERVSVAFLATTEGQSSLTLGETIFSVCKLYDIPIMPQRIAKHPGYVFPETGSTIIIAGYQGRGIDNLLMGIAFDIIIIDEARHIKEEQFAKAYSRLSGTSGKVGIKFLGLLTNPEDMSFWLYPYFIEEGKGHQIFFPSQDNAHNLEPGYLEAMEEELPEFMVRRLVYGEWASAEGAVFPDLERDELLTKVNDIHDQCLLYGAGIDFGFGHSFSFGYWELLENGTIVVWDTYLTTRTDMEIQARNIKNILDCYEYRRGESYVTICCDHDLQDQNELKKMINGDKKRARLINAEKTNKSGVALFVYRLIKHKKLLIIDTPGNRKLISQLQKAVWDPKGGDKILKKEGVKDDALDQFLYSFSKIYKNESVMNMLGLKKIRLS